MAGLGAAPGCPGAAGAGGCSSFLCPTLCSEVFWLQFGNEDLHEAKPTRCPLCGSRACTGLASKGKGKRNQSTLWVGEMLRKHWEWLQFGRDPSVAQPRSEQQQGWRRAGVTWGTFGLCSTGGVGSVLSGSLTAHSDPEMC